MEAFAKEQKIKSFRLSGYIKVFRKSLFVLGVSLCLYAWFGPTLVSTKDSSFQMGQLEIPSIEVSLPIFSKTDEP